MIDDPATVLQLWRENHAFLNSVRGVPTANAKAVAFVRGMIARVPHLITVEEVD